MIIADVKPGSIGDFFVFSFKPSTTLMVSVRIERLRYPTSFKVTADRKLNFLRPVSHDAIEWMAQHRVDRIEVKGDHLIAFSNSVVTVTFEISDYGAVVAWLMSNSRSRERFKRELALLIKINGA